MLRMLLFAAVMRAMRYVMLERHYNNGTMAFRACCRLRPRCPRHALMMPLSFDIFDARHAIRAAMPLEPVIRRRC